MFSKLVVIFVASVASFVAAAPGGISNSCDTGPVQCCDSLYKSDSAEFNVIKQLVGANVPIGALVGSQCSPLSIIGVGGGSSCKSEPVCCDDNKFGGLVAVGCSPVGVNV
ncbi:hydrophobin [Crepidotus variabilis]|uniref:Hydrophobin n=1 Tax=Crepidotus variabilis TaxID=179855 RepID=A0A9P6ERF2_9AGAR|nr:hydrophobin [Crepidotus variabilis]